MKNFFCIFLRLGTSLSKFLLILFFSRTVSPSDVGVYGLFLTSIAWATYVIGYDFYTINTREILSVSEHKRIILVRDQLVFHLLIYIIVFPMLLGIFFYKILPWQLMSIFYCLLIFEHLSQEGERILFTLSKQIFSNSVTFVRAGSWIYLIIIFSLLFKYKISLYTVLYGWLIGDVIGFLLVGMILRVSFNITNWTQIFSEKINWKWILSSAKKATVFFLSTMCLQGMMYLGFYTLKYNESYSSVGVFSYYSSILNVIPAFSFTGIFAFLIPELIVNAKNSNYRLYNATVRKMSIHTLGYILISGVFAAIGIYIVLAITNKTIYLQNLNIYWILLIASLFNVLAFIPHYILYSKRFDVALLSVNAFGFVISIFMNFILIKRYHLYGAAITMLIVYLFLFIGKLSVVLLNKKFFFSGKEIQLN